jgi:hypothetical protein
LQHLSSQEIHDDRNAIRDGHELMLKQMLRMKGQPNLNLNHDFDQV